MTKNIRTLFGSLIVLFLLTPQIYSAPVSRENTTVTPARVEVRSGHRRGHPRYHRRWRRHPHHRYHWRRHHRPYYHHRYYRHYPNYYDPYYYYYYDDGASIQFRFGS